MTKQDGPGEAIQKQSKRRRRKERDPMAPKPGRKRGSTTLHKTLSPAHLEEVHERLIWDGLESVRAYISQLGYNDPVTGECLINIYHLTYYRSRFITKEERMGRKFLGRFLRDFRIRLDAIGAQESLVAIQAMRILKGLDEEEKTDITSPQVGSDIELGDRLVGRLYKMKQEAGLLPQPIAPVQRHQIQADVSQVSATIHQQVGEEAPPGKVKEVLTGLREYLKQAAVKAEDQRMAES